MSLLRKTLDKKMLFLAVVLLLTGWANVSYGVVIFWMNDAPGDRHWSNPDNWSSGRVPNSTEDPAIIKTGSNAPIFDASDGSQSAFLIAVGYTNSGELFIDGGTLTATYGMAFNKGAPSGNSTVYMSGGTLDVNPGFIQVAREGIATFNQTGGIVDTGSLQIPASGFDSYTADGTYNLDDGVINASGIYIAGPSGDRTGVLNITEGKIIFPGDKQVVINSLISSDAIVAYPGASGRRIVNVDYDILNPGKTTVTATLMALEQAWNPQPIDMHHDVDSLVILSWSPGDDANTHDVYLGTDFNDVNNAIVDSNEFMENVDVNSYDPDYLEFGKTYYWRIDEVNGVSTVKGVTWEFTVSYNSEASNPNPGDGVVGVDPNVTLGWSPGDGAIAHEIYFGTNYSSVDSASDPCTPPGRGRQDVNNTSYSPGTLELDETYYWRIDEDDGNDVHKGDIWQFTVISKYASKPNPIDGAEYIARDTELSWSPGYGAISHEIYIGTNFADVNDGTTPDAIIEQSEYEPANLAAESTYYWRVDQNNGAVTYKGDVWEFTTEPAGLIRAFPGAEGYGAYSIGGRGGDVYHVTNLADYNEVTETPIAGSLRYGIKSATGPRTIVFDVSGYIDLVHRLEISAANLTIAGQTAPGDGITLRKHDVRIYDTNNVVIRYLRIRPGHYETGQYESPQGYTDLDTLSIEGGQDIIIDHISGSWSKDECMSVVGESNDITVQWCIMAEPLTINQHAESSLLRPCVNSRLSHHHNLYSDVMTRVTRFGNYNDNVTTSFNWYNNVVYNFGTECTYSNNASGLWDLVNRWGTGSGGIDGEFVELNLIDNYFIAGPQTTLDKAYLGGNAVDHKIWAEGNLMDADQEPNEHDGIDTGWYMIVGSYNQMPEAFSINSPYSWESADNAYNRVLGKAGASLVRDADDERIISEVRSRTGLIPYTQDDVGGWCAIAEVNRPADYDTDGDGMPGFWELLRGFDPNDANDGKLDADSDGYTNLEEYLNYVVVRGIDVLGDFDSDGDVDATDLRELTSSWLDNDCNDTPVGSLDFDCDVDFEDFAILGKDWLMGI